MMVEPLTVDLLPVPPGFLPAVTVHKPNAGAEATETDPSEQVTELFEIPAAAAPAAALPVGELHGVTRRIQDGYAPALLTEGNMNLPVTLQTETLEVEIGIIPRPDILPVTTVMNLQAGPLSSHKAHNARPCGR